MTEKPSALYRISGLLLWGGIGFAIGALLERIIFPSTFADFANWLKNVNISLTSSEYSSSTIFLIVFIWSLFLFLYVLSLYKLVPRMSKTWQNILAITICIYFFLIIIPAMSNITPIALMLAMLAWKVFLSLPLLLVGGIIGYLWGYRVIYQPLMERKRCNIERERLKQEIIAMIEKAVNEAKRG